jgi:hypothetical protein
LSAQEPSWDASRAPRFEVHPKVKGQPFLRPRLRQHLVRGGARDVTGFGRTPVRLVELPGDAGHASASGVDTHATEVIRAAIRALFGR